MESAAEGIRDRLVKDHIALDIEASPEDIGTFLADETRITQVLYNLLSNAVGFSPKDGTIRLRAERRDDSIAFSVTDQGPGIPAENLPFLFERFYRVRAESGATGTGLGLYICRQIVHAHHGKIWAESTLDHGATFFIEFPLPPP
jgi:signal transduction histidine kinase